MLKEWDLKRVAFLGAKGHRFDSVEGTGVNITFTFPGVTPAAAAALFASEEFALCAAFRRAWVQARRAIERVNGQALQ